MGKKFSIDKEMALSGKLVIRINFEPYQNKIWNNKAGLEKKNFQHNLRYTSLQK